MNSNTARILMAMSATALGVLIFTIRVILLHGTIWMWPLIGCLIFTIFIALWINYLNMAKNEHLLHYAE